MYGVKNCWTWIAHTLHSLVVRRSNNTRGRVLDNNNNPRIMCFVAYRTTPAFRSTKKWRARNFWRSAVPCRRPCPPASRPCRRCWRRLARPAERPSRPSFKTWAATRPPPTATSASTTTTGRRRQNDTRSWVQFTPPPHVAEYIWLAPDLEGGSGARVSSNIHSARDKLCKTKKFKYSLIEVEEHPLHSRNHDL